MHIFRSGILHFLGNSKLNGCEQARLFIKEIELLFSETILSIFNGPTQDSFLLIFVFINNNFNKKKIVDFSGIRTGIVGVEGKHADHLTITTALQSSLFASKCRWTFARVPFYNSLVRKVWAKCFVQHIFLITKICFFAFLLYGERCNCQIWHRFQNRCRSKNPIFKFTKKSNWANLKVY